MSIVLYGGSRILGCGRSRTGCFIVNQRAQNFKITFRALASKSQMVDLVAAWLSDNGAVHINKVTLRRARLVYWDR